ncbi:MAG: NADH-quinone oxidoreductase subunit NuoH [Alphaproteobacteria bacterium]
MDSSFWDSYAGTGLILVGTSTAFILAIAVAVAYAVYFDRKIWAAMQLRRGPNVVGPFGLLQSFADAIKLIFKETIVPSGASKGVFFIAPILMFTLAMLGWAVVPFGWLGEVQLVVSDINVGILYLFAVSSLGVYGIIMSGWASNSRYPFLGGLRSAAQMVSYEVSIGFVLITVLLCVGSLNLTDLVEAQRNVWFVLPLFPMFVIFFISALAETNRPPFDLPEAEAELVAGYQVEYSSMTFALFWLGEYANILLMCAMTTLLFFGGWLPPVDIAPFNWIPGPVWFLLKIAFFFFIFAWVKASVPRYRYDQLMRLGWKVFLPISLAAVVVVAGVLVGFDLLPQKA